MAGDDANARRGQLSHPRNLSAEVLFSRHIIMTGFPPSRGNRQLVIGAA